MTDPLEGRPATWVERAGAFWIDVVFGLGAAACLLLIGWSAPQGGPLSWSCIIGGAVLVLAVAVNRLLMPALTGWSLGRGIFGIAVVDRDGKRVGPWRLLVRDIAHLLDTVPLLLGWLWPLVDGHRRTFADIVVRTEVRRDRRSRADLQARAFAVVGAAAVLAGMAGAVGYLGIYRPDTGAAEARQQIATAGPKIVTDMLSYTAASVAEDFAHDQTLVTDSYRPELSEQQDAVRKSGPVDNDYWATNSAVLSATTDRAEMLILLQGQRGTGTKQRLITASVRVDFEKSDTGQWQVNGLTVLGPAKPQPASPRQQAPAGKPDAKPDVKPDGKPAETVKAPPTPSQKPANGGGR
ncbi:MAG TPA: RDD family protein [Mycobacterium sp.]|nr:RDD family protein [Mycobacterium sp.]